MSQLLIRRAIEVAINAITPALPTAWENAPFQPPVSGSAYQKVNIVRGRPQNPTMDAFRREIGFFQVTLFYPLDAGTLDADTRAELVRAAFPKGIALINGGVKVTVFESAYIMQGTPDGNMWMVAVRIPYFSNIG